MVAEPDGGIVSLVHTKEDVDGLYKEGRREGGGGNEVNNEEIVCTRIHTTYNYSKPGLRFRGGEKTSNGHGH